jgi:hypothetical protein
MSAGILTALVAMIAFGWTWFAPSASALNVGTPPSSPPGAVGEAGQPHGTARAAPVPVRQPHPLDPARGPTADRVVNRLGIHTGTLTAAILFHLNVTSAIPATPYLVDADKFMLGNYVGLVSAVLSTVVMMMRSETGTGDEAEREARGYHVWRRSLFVVPTVWLVAQLMVWLIR